MKREILLFAVQCKKHCGKSTFSASHGLCKSCYAKKARNPKNKAKKYEFIPVIRKERKKMGELSTKTSNDWLFRRKKY